MTFDKLILMCDGYTVYQGPPFGVPAHFLKVQKNFSVKIQELRMKAGTDEKALFELDEPAWWNGPDFPKFANPADVALRVLSINYPKRTVDNLKIDSFF